MRAHKDRDSYSGASAGLRLTGRLLLKISGDARLKVVKNSAASSVSLILMLEITASIKFHELPQQSTRSSRKSILNQVVNVTRRSNLDVFALNVETFARRKNYRKF